MTKKSRRTVQMKTLWQHVWSYCEIKQTSAKFDQKTSDGWSLFPVLEIFILSVLLIHICFLIITVALFFVVPNNRQHCQSCELLYSRYEVRLIWFVTAVTCLIEIYLLAIFALDDQHVEACLQNTEDFIILQSWTTK